MGVLITSTGPDGKYYEITLEKVGNDTGTVNAKTWYNGANPGTPPDKDDTTKLYAIRAKANGSMLACKADVFGPDPDVTFTIAGPNQPSVTVTIKGSLGGFGDGTNTYSVTQSDYTKITQFVSTSGFPPLA